MKIFIVLFFSLFSIKAFSSPGEGKYWLRLCDFGYSQPKYRGWQREIGEIKYILIKDEVPLIGYSDQGIFFKDKKICDWKEVSRSFKDKKKYKQSVCPPGTPIELSEISDEDRKKKDDNSYDSQEKFLIKLKVDDLWIQQKPEDSNSNDELISKINFAGDSFELPVKNACEENGDYSELLVNQFMKDKEFSALFKNTINCYQKYPFCKDIKEIKKEIGKRFMDEASLREQLISYFGDLKKNAPKMAEVFFKGGNDIEVQFRPRNWDISPVVLHLNIMAVFKREREYVEGKAIKENPRYGSWKLKLELASH